jgi:beta-glucosidase
VWSHGDDVTASVRVTNTGDRAGWAVPQAYVSFPRGTGEPPWQLKGYEKVSLAPRQSRTVTFRLDSADLSVFAGRNVVPRGRYELAVGTSSRDFDRVASFDLGRW